MIIKFSTKQASLLRYEKSDVSRLTFLLSLAAIPSSVEKRDRTVLSSWK